VLRNAARPTLAIVMAMPDVGVGAVVVPAGTARAEERRTVGAPHRGPDPPCSTVRTARDHATDGHPYHHPHLDHGPGRFRPAPSRGI
jgi:hypothetical protein